jgi:hypothetical protein
MGTLGVLILLVWIGPFCNCFDVPPEWVRDIQAACSQAVSQSGSVSTCQPDHDKVCLQTSILVTS